MKIRYLKKFLKISGIALLVFIMLLITGALVLQLPAVQTWVANKVLNRIERNTGTKASLDYLEIDFPRHIVLNGFYLQDLDGDTLVYAGKLTASIRSFRPFKREINVGELRLDDAAVNLKRPAADTAFNIAFLMKPGEEITNQERPSKTRRPYSIDVGTVELNRTEFRLIDERLLSLYPVYLEQFRADVRRLDLENKVLEIGTLNLVRPEVSMKILGKKPPGEKEPLVSLVPDLGWTLAVERINVESGEFHQLNPFADASPQLPFDPAEWTLYDINTGIRNFRLDSIIRAEIEELAVNDGDRLSLNRFAGSVSIYGTTITTRDLAISFNRSSLTLDSRVELQNLERLPEELYHQSDIHASIHPADANLFLPPDRKILKTLQLDFRGSGNLERMTVDRFAAAVNGARISGNGVVSDILDQQALAFDVNLSEVRASAAQLSGIADWIAVPGELGNLGEARLTGNASGSIADFYARLRLDSDLGGLTTDLRLRTGDRLRYNGDVLFEDLHVSLLFPEAGLGHISGKMELHGSGTDLEQLQADLTGSLDYLDFNGYRYEDMALKGRVADQVFDGSIHIEDECLYLDFLGELDFGDTIPAIDGKLHVDHADLQSLKLMDDKLIVSVDGDFEVTGLRPSEMNGTLHMNRLELVNNYNSVVFDTTLLTIRSEPDYKQYDLVSNDLVASLRGNFDPLAVPGEVKRHLSHYIYYVGYPDSIPETPQQIEGTVSLAEGFGLTRFFLGNVELPDNLEATFSFDNVEEHLSIDIHSNFVGYKKYGVDTLDFNLTTKGPAILVDAKVDGLNINNSKVKIREIGLTTASTKDYITWNLEVQPEEAPNRLSLSPQVEFLGDSVIVHFLDSYIRLNGVNWPFNEQNQLIVKDDAFIAENFAIYNKDQYLEIINASSDLTDVSLEFSGLDIPALANIIELDTIIQQGKLSGIIRVLDPMEELNADIDLRFDSLRVFDYYCREIGVDGWYTKMTNKIDLALYMEDRNYNLDAFGTYDLTPGIENSVDLTIDVDTLDLSFIDKILKGETDINAWAKGDMQLRGTITEPILLGDAVMLDTAVVHINFLGVDIIMVEEEVAFSENTMDFKSINVMDAFGNMGYLEGKLTHTHFKDMSVSATLATDNYNLLNTTFRDNEQFYGTAFGNGTVRFSGLTRSINIDMDMQTMPNTYISIPLAKAGDTKQYDDIIFINPYDTVVVTKVEEEIEIKGVNLDFDLEVTPDAQLELVLNTDSENNMIARGSGNLDLQIDQNKQLSIYGRYDIRDGKYTFSPQNLLNKRFNILNGSYLNWTGEPFEAELDVEAAYSVKARVDNILEDSTRASETLPMDVIIEIGGTMDDTEVAFDIRPAQTGLINVPDEVTIFLDDIKDDEGEVTTQAIALLLVGRFLPSNSTVFADASFSAGDFGKTTAFELISNQISNYLTDAISKLITEAELNFAFTQREDYTLEEPGQTTEFQVDFQTSFVDNRIILKVGGNFEVNDAESTQENTIAGDFEVEGLLTRDGRLRGKAYHRTADYDIFNQDRSKTGIGISYQKDFNKIGEVFKPDPLKKARRKIKRQDRRDRKEDKRVRDRREKAVKDDEQ